MATRYTCDQCGKTAASTDGWYLVAVQLLYDDPAVTTDPGGRTLQSTQPDYHFDTELCRARWLAGKDLPPPAPPV